LPKRLYVELVHPPALIMSYETILLHLDDQPHCAERARAGEVLLSQAVDLGVDLLVMGAYGHSRVRELVLGGATRTVLNQMTLPVLMSH
jgi:Universal stress protein family